MDNFFYVPVSTACAKDEFFETFLKGPGSLRVERIISHGHTTPDGQWYDQDQDEWVMVLEGNAKIGYPDGSEVSLQKGDHCLLPKHTRHRVVATSSPCIWLAMFGDALIPVR